MAASSTSPPISPEAPRIVNTGQFLRAWRHLVWLLATTFFALLVFVMSSRPPDRHAYVYHPATDTVYLITLGPDVGPYDRAPYLMPYTTPLFGAFKSVVSLGPLAHLGRSSSTSGKEPPRKAGPGTREDVAFAAPRELYVMTNPDYTRQRDINPASLLPTRWDGLRSYLDDDAEDLIAADIVLIPPAGTAGSRVSILRAALFIRGPAAAEIWAQGFH